MVVVATKQTSANTIVDSWTPDYFITCTATATSCSDFYSSAPNKKLKMISEKEEKRLKKIQRGF